MSSNRRSAFRSYLINGFGKGMASAVPLRTNKDAAFSPEGTQVYRLYSL